MTRKQMIFFVGIFLFIIYIVPGVQTVYEYTHNDGHRIQILDLLQDLFITPSKKADSDATVALDLKTMVDSLVIAVPVKDTSLSWNSAEAERFADEALVKTHLLRKSIQDYNRHLKGGNNPYIADDTVKPFYHSLVRLQENLGEFQSSVSGSSPASLGNMLSSLASDAKVVQEAFPGSVGHYGSLTLTAFRRIMVGASYLRPYEKEMENTSVFTNAVRPKYLLAYYSLFGYLGDKGLQGRQEWLYYKPDVEYLVRPYMTDEASIEVDANDMPLKDAIVDSIKAFQKVLAERGIELIVIPMPGKPSIYPEMLASAMGSAMSGRFSHSLRMLRELNDAGVTTVDLFAAFSSARADDEAAGDSLYMRTDTHFKTRAVRIAAKAVADRIKQYPWYVPGTASFAIDTVTIQRSGDIAEMTKLNALTIRQLKLSFPLEKVKCYQVYQVALDDKGMETGRSLYRDDYRNSQVLVLGDSYSRIYQTDEPRSAGWISHLAVELSQPVASIVNDGGASTLVRETLARKLNVLKGKKVVVWEIVERDFRYGDKGWRNVSLEEKKKKSFDSEVQ